MKHRLHYLFLLIFCSILFSCSDSDDNDRTPYPVEFNISNPSILDAVSPSISQYVIYKENGDVLDAYVSEMGNASQALSVEKELTPGKYTFAIGFGRRYSMTAFIWKASNLNQDYCSGNALIMGNGNISGIYFESISFEVSENSNKSFDLELQNMGRLLSDIKVNISNYDSYVYPNPTANENRVSIGYRIASSHRGFSIKDKGAAKESYEATSWSGNSSSLISINELKGNRGVWSLPLLVGADHVKIELIFLEDGPAVGGNILKSEVIYEGKIESGKNITLTGELGQSSSFTKSE